MAFISPQYIAGFSALLCVIASAGCYGWVTPIMKYLENPHGKMYMSSAQIAFMVSIIAIGEIFTCVPSGLMADKMGRKFCILICGPMYALTWCVIVISPSYLVICIMRLIQGVAMGLVFTVVPIYLGEISSPCQRGSITGLFSAAWFLGYLLEYCVGPYLSYIAYTVLTASVSIIFTVTFISQPESPYYLLTVGRADEALLTLRRLRKGCSEESIKREYDNMKESVKEDSSTATSWNDLIATPADRRALVIIFLIGGTRILSGAMAVMSYSTELFNEAGIKALSPDVLTICLGFAFLFGGLVNAFIVDQVGRRPLIFISCAGSFVSLLTVGVYFYLRKSSSLDVTPYSWVVPLGVIMYCVFSVVGIYPVSMTYTSELFTTRTRGRAASLSSINLAIFSFICIELYQYVGDNFGLDKVFFVFASVCLSGAIALYFLAPETKGKTFTEIRADILHVKERKESIIVREDYYI